jgi:hypothetical protein
MCNEDFYIILPSNSNALDYPNNNASKYIVSWQNAIELKDLHRWRVALREISFYYPHVSATKNYGIKLLCNSAAFSELQDLDMRLTYKDDVLTVSFPTFSNRLKPIFFASYTFDPEGRGIAFSSLHFFEIIFQSPDDAGLISTSRETRQFPMFNHEKKQYVIEFRKIKQPTKESEHIIRGIKIKIKDTTELVEHTFILNKDYHWSNTAEMLKDLNMYFFTLFTHQADMVKENRLTITKPESGQYADAIKLTFTNAFNYVLGFKNKSYEFGAGRVLTAEFEPQLYGRAVDHMYVYSSITAPIQVGDTLAPLLKAVWLKSKKDFVREEVRSINIKNKMYLPVSTSSINSVEINVRTDSGHFVPFSDSAITSITLHFKKISNNG